MLLQVSNLLSGEASAKTKQATLTALGSLASAYGDSHPGPIISAIPSVLAQAKTCLLFLLLHAEQCISALNRRVLTSCSGRFDSSL